MSTHIITATEASRSLSLIFNRVHYQGEHYEIKRGKEIIAQIIPVEPKNHDFKAGELKKFFETLPKIDDEDKNAFEADIEYIRSQSKHEDESWD